MKQVAIMLAVLIGCFCWSSSSKAEVIWDNAEIAKGQVGKMTFSKDVKVYKKESDGSFTSLVVKAGNFFRVYYVENSTVGIVYGMSNGYRVQSTELVIYRAVPQVVQSMFGVTIKEKTTVNSEQNIQTKTYEVSEMLYPAAQRKINEQLSTMILEQTEVELSYLPPVDGVYHFYEYGILTNANNRLAIFRQQSSCMMPCDSFQYDMNIDLFNIVTGDKMTIDTILPDVKVRAEVKQYIEQHDPKGQIKMRELSSIPFYEDGDGLHFMYNYYNKLVEIDVPSSVYIKK